MRKEWESIGYSNGRFSDKHVYVVFNLSIARNLWGKLLDTCSLKEMQRSKQHKLLITQQLNRMLLSKSHHSGAHRWGEHGCSGKGKNTHLWTHQTKILTATICCPQLAHAKTALSQVTDQWETELGLGSGTVCYAPILNHTPYLKLTKNTLKRP